MTFGIVIACCPSDLRYLKGCLASLRYYMPDIPVHLIVDGERSAALDQIALASDCTVVVRDDTRDLELKRRSFGWGLTKMVALWEAPFERFLYLDPDLVCFGNLAACDQPDIDFLPAVDGLTRAESWVNAYFYDLGLMQRFWPGYDWRSVKHLHFASGCFFARRNALDLNLYLELLDLSAKHPQLFKCGDQGLLNFMALHGFQHHRISLARASCNQILVNEFNTRFLAREFRFKADTPSGMETALHYAGPKPDVFRNNCFPLMTAWRLEYRRILGARKTTARLSLAIEDAPVLTDRLASISRRVGRRIARLCSPKPVL